MRHVSLLALLLAACTPLRPQVSLEPGASLSRYHLFVVEPVTDQTGAAFNLPVADTLRQEIADRLRSHGLQLAEPKDTAGPALVLVSTLERFKGMPIEIQMSGPGSGLGVTMCALRSVLRDRDTGRRLGEILAQVQEERVRPLTVLNECAHDVGDALYRELRR